MYTAQNDVLRSSLLPILLGDSRAAHALSFKIYIRCGVRSCICDSRSSFLDLIDPSSSFFDMISDSEDAVLLEGLRYIAEESDYLLVLVPCSERFERLISEHREFFESRFILRTRENLFNSEPFLALLKGE